MSEHRATIHWQRDGTAFADDCYSRAHAWSFDGGITVAASSSPQVVAPPMSDPGAVDPEEAFVASLSSCHMLWFLSISRARGHVVDRYVDDALGTLGRNADGRLAITVVTLSPEVTFDGPHPPDRDALVAMHEAAHASCFIASSVRTEVRCVPVFHQPI